MGLANIKSQILVDEDLGAMEQSLSIAIDARNTAPLNFSLARGWHDRKQYDQAFHHYPEGNRIRAEEIGYLANELTEEVDEYIRLYDPAFIDRGKGLTTDGPVPIFVVSLPRSGSTLLEQMLGSHPDIAPAGELAYIPALVRTMMEQHTRRGHVTIPQAILRMEAEEAQASGAIICAGPSFTPEGTSAFVDKLPHNWSNILFIRRILPRPRSSTSSATRWTAAFPTSASPSHAFTVVFRIEGHWPGLCRYKSG